jgi:hypothetical protein
VWIRPIFELQVHPVRKSPPDYVLKRDAPPGLARPAQPANIFKLEISANQPHQNVAWEPERVVEAVFGSRTRQLCHCVAFLFLEIDSNRNEALAFVVQDKLVHAALLARF